MSRDRDAMHYDARAIGLAGWQMAAITDPGRVRADNEDCVLLLPQEHAALLADGMGGHAAGEIASALAVTAAAQALRLGDARSATTRVRRACLAAHRAVIAEGEREPQWRGMGSTLLVLLAQGPHIAVGHVGDSRAYRWREGRLSRLTVDHSAAETLGRQGLWGAAGYSSARHLLTRAIGTEPTIDPEIKLHRWAPGDRYLLCSDGLTDALSHTEIAAILVHSGDDLPRCLRELVLAANAHGGPDNISAILIETAGP